MCSIDTRHISLESLIPSDPALRCIGDGNQPFEDLRCAFVDVVRVTDELEEFFAVWAAAVHELCVGAYDGANHTSAQVALLVRWNEGAARNHVGHLDGGNREVRDSVPDSCQPSRGLKFGRRLQLVSWFAS